MSHTWAKCRSCFQSPQKSTKDLREELIDHFASFQGDLPIQIDRIYMSLAAKESGLSQTHCEQLSSMFYQPTNSMVDKDAWWKKLEELSDETVTTSRAGESYKPRRNMPRNMLSSLEMLCETAPRGKYRKLVREWCKA